MRDEDLEKLMERWADHEIASAPEMHPTADMYRMVRAKTRRNRFSVLFARRLLRRVFVHIFRLGLLFDRIGLRIDLVLLRLLDLEVLSQIAEGPHRFATGDHFSGDR